MYNWHNVFQPIYQIDQNMNPRIDHYEMLLPLTVLTGCLAKYLLISLRT